MALRRFNLATLSQDDGDLARAHTLFSQTLSAQERSLGANHPFTALARASLSSVLNQLGETESARAEATRAALAVADQPAGSLYRVQVEQLAARVLGTAPPKYATTPPRHS